MIRFRTRIHVELKLHKNDIPTVFVLELSGPCIPDRDELSNTVGLACKKYRRLPEPQRNPQSFASLLNSTLPGYDMTIYMPDYAAESDETGRTVIINACLD